jgi:hypothetical protein
MHARWVLVSLLAVGCVKEISSEERLDRESPPPLKGGHTPAQLAKMTCQDAPASVSKAREVNRPETDRVQTYMDLYDSLRKRTDAFEDALRRNPDLNYQDGSAALVEAKDFCIQQTADVRLEFERYVRELVEVPTVQEVKGGNSITVARLDFAILREAIELLGPDDKDQLLTRVASAEKKVEPSPQKGKRGKER